MLACRLLADPSVDWISDSYSSFDVILSGTGSGWSGTITSPSGLWQLFSANLIQYPSNSGSSVMMNNSGMATYQGALPSWCPAPDPSGVIHTVSITAPPGNTEYHDPNSPFSDRNPMNYGYLCELSFFGSFQNWRGMSDFSVTSIPNANDPSTWAWTAEYSASGESLGVAPVPEPGILSFAALAAILGLGLARWRGRDRLDLIPVRMNKKEAGHRLRPQ